MTHSGLTSVALDAAFFRFAITSLQKIVVRELRGLLGARQALPIGQTPPCSKRDAALRDLIAARFYQAAMLGLFCQCRAPPVFSRRTVHRAIGKLISREVKEQQACRRAVVNQEVQDGKAVAVLIIAL